MRCKIVVDSNQPKSPNQDSWPILAAHSSVGLLMALLKAPRRYLFILDEEQYLN